MTTQFNDFEFPRLVDLDTEVVLLNNSVIEMQESLTVVPEPSDGEGGVQWHFKGLDPIAGTIFAEIIDDNAIAITSQVDTVVASIVIPADWVCYVKGVVNTKKATGGNPFVRYAGGGLNTSPVLPADAYHSRKWVAASLTVRSITTVPELFVNRRGLGPVTVYLVAHTRFSIASCLVSGWLRAHRIA